MAGSKVKLYPVREDTRLQFRDSWTSKGSTRFYPFRLGKSMLLRGMCQGKWVYGWPYRDGTHLMARTVLCADEEMVWCCRQLLPQNKCELMTLSECLQLNGFPNASEETCIEACFPVKDCPILYDCFQVRIQSLRGTLRGRNWGNNFGQCAPDCLYDFNDANGVYVTMGTNFPAYVQLGGCPPSDFGNWLGSPAVEINLNVQRDLTTGLCYMIANLRLMCFNNMINNTNVAQEVTVPVIYSSYISSGPSGPDGPPVFPDDWKKITGFPFNLKMNRLEGYYFGQQFPAPAPPLEYHYDGGFGSSPCGDGHLYIDWEGLSPPGTFSIEVENVPC